eukprot:1538029-Pyramimonas_sp.AAC.1
MLIYGASKKKNNMNIDFRRSADFLDRRWSPLAAPPAPFLARSARQGGDSAPIQSRGEGSCGLGVSPPFR